MQTINPLRLTLAEAAQILAKTSGLPVTEETIKNAIAEGMPANPDETLNLVYVAAWLNKEVANAN
jgi:hypothetical protein